MPRFSLGRSALLVLAMALLPALGRAQVIAPNDDFTNATVIGALPFSHPVGYVVSSIEPGDPASCTPGINGNVWYSFTPAVNTAVLVNFDSMLAVTAVSVFTGSPGMLEGACSPGRSASFTATAGTTYFIRLETFAGASGAFYTLTVTETTPPPPTVIAPNDEFANATVIGGLPFSYTANGVISSRAPGDPFSCAGMADGNVWYSFTPDSTTSVQVNVDPYVYVSVFTGSPGMLEGICGGSFIATAGTTYFIRLETETGSAGSTYTLTVTGVTAPPHDGVAEAQVIDTLPFSQTVDGTLATAAPDDPFPSCAGSVPTSTVWYAFASELPVRLRLSADASVASVYTGSPGSFTEVACTSGGIINFSPGVAYSIMVSGNATSYTFTIEVAPAAPVIILTVDPVGSVDKAGVATVTGTVTCSGAPSVDVSGTLQQFGPRRVPVLGYFGTSAACTGLPVAWTASAAAASSCGCTTTQLGPGPGTITANATACGPLECTPSVATDAIRLR